MDSERDKRKSLLYADLFKSHKNLGFEDQKNFMISDGSSGDSSSSSGFSTPFDSELGSFGSEDEEFMEELSRQMAECMLKEEVEVEEDKTTTKVANWASGPVKNQYMSQRYTDSTHFNPEHQMSHIQVYQLKNQPPVRHGKKSCAQYRGKRKGNDAGSGMKAIFLGEYGSGSGSSKGSSGTGVFLPRSPNDPNQVKKKSACSTVLIPTRVLQTLELHRNRVSTSASTLLSGENRDRSNGRDKCMRFPQHSDLKLENWSEKINKEDEMCLPQEWTY